MNYNEIGRRIRKFRKMRGFSQEELAERVDISVPHMSHIETGNTKLSLPVLVAIAGALEVRTDDLLFDWDTTTHGTAAGDIADILNHCTPGQAKALADIVKTAKQSMDKYL
ncbi:MAG: helix-turn-helix transcriptional regulator [Clostridia bacterium]|nr:helix-turn-helix transcriptional regulator [Clostridia bacterium]